MAASRKNSLLALSLVANVLLVTAIVVYATRGCGSKDNDHANHLVLQVRCGDGDQAACEKVAAIDRAGCDRGDGHSCVLLGIAHQVGKRATKDDTEAARYFVKGCDLGNASGCWYAGSCYLRGRGVEPSMDRALQLLTKACEKEERNGCLELGDTYIKRTPPDTDRALQSWDRGCRLGYEWACSRATKLRAEMGSK